MLSKEKGSKEKGEDHAVGTDREGKRIGKSGDDQIALDVHVSIPLTMLKELENDNYSVLMLVIFVMSP